MACYENVGNISCGAKRCLVGVVSREPNTLQWDRVEAWWSSEDLCLLRSACGGWGISTQKKKLNVTEADRSTTPRAWGRVPGVRFERCRSSVEIGGAAPCPF